MSRKRIGIGRLDLVIIVAVLALLSVNLVPWVQSAREVARRVRCQDNLRQLSVAVSNYVDTHQSLLPAAYWTADGLVLEDFYEDGRPFTPTHENWLQLVLPYIDSGGVKAEFDVIASVTAPANAAARMSRQPLFNCPSDEYNRDDNPFILPLTGGSEASFARGNYAINGGAHYWVRSPGYLSNPRPEASHYEFDAETRHFEFWGSGIAGINRCFKLDDVSNGLSTTVAVEEVRAGVDPIDPRGVWALGQIGSSITWGHGVTGDAGQPNSVSAGPDDIARGPELFKLKGGEWLREEGMPCCSHCDQSQQATARSRHPGGVNVLMLDGAVRFIANEIDPPLWQVLHSRIAPADVFDETVFDLLDGGRVSDTEAECDAAGVAEVDLPAGEVIRNSLGMQFVCIPAGTFMMGQPNAGGEQGSLEDSPEHKVRITRSYLLGIHEVTQQQYEQVMGQTPSWHAPTGGGAERIAAEWTPDFPVEDVTWYEAVEFCELLSQLPEEISAGRRYRLPTEAEWEYACRAGQTTAYALNARWDDNDQSGIIASKSVERKDLVPDRIGSYPPNPIGVYDMCGNVFEWTSDWYGRDYYARSPVDDPQGPDRGYLKVLRGWYWIFTGPACKDLLATSPWIKSRFVGFRVVCEPVGDSQLAVNERD